MECATPERGALIGLDWGTSRVRAYLFDDTGSVIAQRAEPWGVMAARGTDFAALYRRLVAGWQTADGDLPVIAAGMIGSTEGWVRAPYCRCPAGPDEIARSLTAVRTDADGVVWIVPGVDEREPQPDFMRGEETQVAGALTMRPELASAATLILPGTHAKWVHVTDGRIVGFTTYMTGELWAVLGEHSILGRPARTAGRTRATDGWEAFDDGLATAQRAGPAGLAPLLFAARSRVLAGIVEATESLEFLSGVLIGDELRGALAGSAPQLVLVGEPALCERYARALHAFGKPAPIVDSAASAGLWTIACRAELVAGAVRA